jgi:UDP-N-acetylmuramyl pentapeptide phosphotransferase/UDP-N-acetylglucosamine-1-phosphate transferase
VLTCLLLSFILSAVINYFLILKGIARDLTYEVKEHAIHESSVSRAGGLGIFIPVAFCLLVYGYYKLFILSSLVFIVGFLEDLFKNMSPKIRLALILIVSFLTLLYNGWHLPQVPFFPEIIVFFALMFAISGYINAINIIDGLNGLASGISITFIVMLAATFYSLGEYKWLPVMVGIVGAIIGFLVFNFPKGKIFLGDGGAYLLGYLSAFFSLRLLAENPEVSVLYPIVLGIYPVWEVLYSAYRRLKKGIHPFSPDKKHFHTLLFCFLGSNYKASLVINFWVLLLGLMAYFFYDCAICLLCIMLVFVISYEITYSFLEKKCQHA